MSKRTKSSQRPRSRTTEQSDARRAWRLTYDSIPKDLAKSFWQHVEQRVVLGGYSLRAVRRAVREYQEALGERSIVFAYHQGEARTAEVITDRLVTPNGKA